MSSTDKKVKTLLEDEINMRPIMDDSTEKASNEPTIFYHSDAIPAAPPVGALDKNIKIQPRESTTDRVVHSMKDAMHSIGQHAVAIKDAVLGYHPDVADTTSASSSSKPPRPVGPPMHHVLHDEEEPVHSIRPLKESELPDETHMSHEQSLAKKAQAALNIVGHKIVEAKDSFVNSLHAATHTMPGDEPYVNEQDDEFRLSIARDKARGHIEHNVEIVTPDGQHTVIDGTGQERTFQACSFPEKSSLMEPTDTFMPAKDNTSIKVGSGRSTTQQETLSSKAQATAHHMADVASDKMHVAGQRVAEAAHYATARIVTEAGVVGDAIKKKASDWSHDASAKAKEFSHSTKEYAAQGVQDLKTQAQWAANDASVKTKAFASAASQKASELAGQAKVSASNAAASAKTSASDLATTTKAKFAEATGSNLQKPPNDLDRSPIKHVMHHEEEPIKSVGPIDPNKLPDETNMDHAGSLGKKLEHGAKLVGRRMSAAKDEIAKAMHPSHRKSASLERSDEEFHSQIHHDMLEASKQPRDVPFEMVLSEGQHLPIRDEFAPVDSQFHNRMPHREFDQASKFQSQSGLLEEKTQEA